MATKNEAKNSDTRDRAWQDVVSERRRQRAMEGYDDTHDDAHEDFSLSCAAVAYIRDAVARGGGEVGFAQSPPPEWPWSDSDWKPKDIRRALVVSAALLVAEIERLDRIGDIQPGA
jgi:hypothetical protein